MSRRKRSAAGLTRLSTLIAGAFSLAGPGSLALAKPPTLSGLFPPGAARGQTATVTASGTFDHWPVKGWAEGSGVEILAGPEKGKLSIRVAEDAQPGVRWVRLHDEEGATDLRPFIIGTLPEVIEVEPNDEPSHPQAISLPSATVNGRLARGGDVDGYSVMLGKGQTLVADLEANRHLGAPMDAVLQVVSASGFVLAQNDDAVGRDPRIVFEAPTAGTYLIRVFAFPVTPDSSIRFAGGEAFLYRLTLTTAGFLDHVFPLAIFKDGRGSVEAVGSNLPQTPRRLTVPLGDDDHRDLLRVSHPLLAGTAVVRSVADQMVIESEPNDLARPQEIPNRSAVSARIDERGDRDAYRIVLKKGDTRLIRVESRSLGYPLDAVLRVFGADAKVLAEADDVGQKRDPELSFTSPLDGEYRIVVRDLNGNGGPRFAYLLNVTLPEPDFTLALAAGRFDVTPGTVTRLSVNVDRKSGYSAPIEVLAENLPAGVVMSPAISRPGDASAKSVMVELRADVRALPGPFRVVGKSLTGSRRVHLGNAAIGGFDVRTDSLWITIRPAAVPSNKSQEAGKPH